MSIWKDLKKTVEHAAGDTASIAWRGTKAVGSEILDSTHPKEWGGDVDAMLAQIGKDVPGASLFTGGLFGIAKPEDILAAHDKGGGRAVWETQQGTNPGIVRWGNDIAIDPTTYLSLGGSSVGKGLVEKGGAKIAAGGFGNEVAGTAIRGAGRIAQVAELPDKAMDKAVAPFIGAVAKRLPEGFVSISKKESVRKELDAGYAIYKDSKHLGSDVVAEQGALEAKKMGVAGMPQVNDLGTIFDNAMKRIKNKLPLTTWDVGDRTFERGPFAGMDTASAVGDAMIQAKDARDWFINNKVIWSATDTTREIRKGLAKFPAPRGQEALSRYDAMAKQGLDPLHSPIEDIAKSLFLSGSAEDKTIASLSGEGNKWLLDNKITVGPYRNMSYQDALTRMEKEFFDDKDTVEKAISYNVWPTGTKPDEIKSMLKGDRKALAAWKKWDEVGVDILHHPQEESAFSLFERQVYASHGIATERRGSTWNDIASVWKGVALMSPRYHTSNISSAWFNTILVNGFGGLTSPQQFYAQIKHELNTDPNLYDTLALSTVNKTLDDYGIMRMNRNLAKSGLSSIAGGSQQSAERVFSRILGRKIGEPTGQLVGKAIEKNRRVGVGIDAASRSVLWDTKFKATFEELLPELEKQVNLSATKQGLTIAPGTSAIPFRDPQMLLGYYRALGFTDGESRHLSRNVANAINKSDKAAIDLVHKGMFSYYRSGLDEFLSNVIPFHYYASRSTLLYAEEMMRNPILLVNFTRMMEELYNDYENSGLNARQRGWLNVMSGPAGYNLLMNPDALLGFTKAVGLMGDNYAGDQTALGGILTWMKAGGYGLYPWVDGAFNMVGAYGDTFEPDMLGIRHRALVGAAVNYVSAELGVGTPGMQDAPYAELNAKARGHISQWASSFLPGWMSQPVQPKANRTGTIAEATMEKSIESRILYNNPGMTYQQLFDIMNDPESPQYQAAWREVARTGIANQLLSFTIPFGTKLRDSSADVRNAGIGVAYKYADKYNISAADVNPSTDAKFAAEYKRVTGTEWKPGSFDDAKMKQDLASATQEARPFILNDYQYSILGTPLAQKTRNTYNKIKYGDIVPPGYAKPVQGDEEKLADLWLSKQGKRVNMEYQELLALQDSFKKTHPQFGAFKDWVGQMSYLRSLSGGSLGYYRETVSKNNPNAAKYFEAKKDDLMSKVKDFKDFSERMDMATMSPDAWFAITGVARSVSDQRPLSTNTAYDPLSPMVDAGRGYSDSQSAPQTAQDPTASWLQQFG